MENTKNSNAEKAGFGSITKESQRDLKDFRVSIMDSWNANEAPEPTVYRKVVHSRLVCLNGRIHNLGTFNSRDAAERAVADFNARKRASIKEKLKSFFCF